MEQFGRLTVFNFLLLIAFFSSCGQKSGPCEGGMTNPCCVGKELGNIGFIPGDSNWIPSGVSQINFQNNNGFKTIFYSTKGATKYSGRYNMVSKSQKCQCGTDYCYDYVTADVMNMIYVSNNTPYSFSYTKSIKITSHNTTYDTLNGDNILNIIINNISFDMPMNRLSNKNYVHLDSIQFSNISYKDVFHVYTDSSMVDNTVIVPRGLYYSLGVGLIGFYLTNGELWTLF